jgi:hypothetical protein
MGTDQVSTQQLIRRVTAGLAAIIVGGLGVSIWAAFGVETFEARVTKCGASSAGRDTTYSCTAVWRDPIDGTERTGPVSGLGGAVPATVDDGTIISVRATRYPNVVQEWDVRAKTTGRAVAAVATCVIVVAVLALTRAPRPGG